MIKVGDVVFHKASGEPGYLINIVDGKPVPMYNEADNEKFSGTIVVVRSPKGGADMATSYVTQRFMVEEVETREGQLEREQDLMGQIFQRGSNVKNVMGMLPGGNIQN